MTPFFNEAGRMHTLHFPDFGFSALLDVAIVATLIYFIMSWIRKTHAWALMKGIVIFSLVALMAYFFNLVTVIWVVQNAFAMGLIAVVILFQPELRKALEKLGKGVDLAGLGHIGGSESRSRRDRLSKAEREEIVQAVCAMAKRRTGALICLERDVSLSEQEQQGAPLDALITRQLLMNIFADRTPLHDGAVIIRGHRIAAAACILPLTSQEIDQELGTRHRAAVGASEASDAMVIVVSEETGSISVAYGGELRRHTDERALHKLLALEFATQTRGPRRRRPWQRTSS